MFASSHPAGDGGFLPRFAGLDAQPMPVLRTRVPARLSAAASCQSRVVASRAVLEMQVPDRLRRHPGGAVVPRPRRGALGCCSPTSSSGENRQPACTTGSATGGSRRPD